jgi:undecaprenyl diphosphate synthase
MNQENKIPKSVGIIMDGNRRWAKMRGLPLLEGHTKGGETLKNTVGWARDLGVQHIIFYTFSTENWNRTEEEVNHLIGLISKFIKNELDYFHKEGGVLHYVGDLTKFSSELQKDLLDSQQKTSGNNGPHVYFALNYGGRSEILNAVKKAVADSPKPDEITEEYFSKYLQTGDMPDPDIIIRTSGEKRLSGFLPWQGVYSELFFIDTLWPDFSKEEFEKIIEEYGERERRMGK